MKRAVTALVATAAGVMWIAAYRVAPHTNAVSNAAPAPSGSSPVAPSPAATPSATPNGPTGTFTGTDVSTIFGDNQVQIMLKNGRIADVKAVRLPYDRPRSQEISSIAGPELRQEALQAQSAKIDAISGATYTSEAYAQSLEDALRQGGLG